MSKKRKRRIMRSFKMNEISTVDRPAQEGATVAITKRDDGAGVLGDLLAELHDAVPNAEKSSVAALIAKQEANEDPETMAREILERATSQFDRMVMAFAATSGADMDAAEEAMMGSRIGRRLTALIGAAERMLSEDDDAEDSEASRRAETARMAARVGTTRLASKSAARSAIAARDSTDDELDRLAEARSERTGEDFYTAYEAVCGTDEGIRLITKRDGFHAMAIGSAEHGRTVDLTKRNDGFDVAVRNSDLYKSVHARANAVNADDALMKRAKAIQLERCDPCLSLVGALEIAKAERPELAKAARI